MLLGNSTFSMLSFTFSITSDFDKFDNAHKTFRNNFRHTHSGDNDHKGLGKQSFLISVRLFPGF